MGQTHTVSFVAPLFWPHRGNRRSTQTRTQWAALAGLLLVCFVVPPVGAVERHRLGDGPQSEFAELWLVDRTLPDLYEVLAEIVGPDGFEPIVLTDPAGDRADTLNHLLEIVPNGVVHWVSRDPVPAGLSVDLVVSPDIVLETPAAASTVYCRDPELMPFAALVAMRTGRRLSRHLPQILRPGDLGVGDGPLRPGCAGARECPQLQSVGDCLRFLNARATRQAVLVFAVGSMRPEYVLYALQRGVLLLEVAPPPYSGEDPQSEVDATVETAAQIRSGVAAIPELGGAHPEALVVAGDWTEIPYRFAREADFGWIPCEQCDNGIRTFSSDVEYGNLDGDSWGEPEVATGRLMSYETDLLALQSVLGVWRDRGAFAPAARAVFLGVYANGLRDRVLQAWREDFPDRQWELVGPQNQDEDNVFDFEVNDFLDAVDASDVVLFDGHGSPNGLYDARRLLDGEILASTADSASPAFWFVTACATGRYLPETVGGASPQGNGNLVSGLQARLVVGGWLTVEVIASPSANLVWPGMAAERPLPVGEIVRRGMATAISAYRGDADSVDIPPLLPRRTGQDQLDRANAWATSFWLGDPLTEL